MHDTVLYSRFQFGLTLIFHYLFPQLTMSAAAFVAWFRLHELWGDRREHFQAATAFWTKLLALTFVFGVITGIPLEFQFGTNWAAFSNFSGGVIGQTLALEGVFAFFTESAFLGIMLAGEQRVGPRLHLVATLVVMFGAWLSAYFILATDAWLQHPVAYAHLPDGRVSLTSIWGLLGNSWILWQFLHNQCASMVTGSFVVAATGAFYLLLGRDEEFGRTFLKTGIIAAAVFSCLVLYPTGDGESRQVFDYQGAKAAAMEGQFHTETGAPIAIMGQPDMATLTLDNPILIPKVLSFLTYRRWTATVHGLTDFPREDWPDNVPLVYYAYHIMVGLGSCFVAVALLALLLLLWGGRLYRYRWMLWILLITAPFPYIATTAGWVTAEVGRQPWIAWGLFRTAAGATPVLNSGNAMFTFLGFIAMDLSLGMIYFVLAFFEILHGPAGAQVEELQGMEA